MQKIVIKLTKIKDKEKLLKATREEIKKKKKRKSKGKNREEL